MPSRRPPGAFHRFLAFATYSLHTATVVLLVLTFAFPTWGYDPNRARFTILYFPPQAFAAAYVGITALGLAALLGLLALGTGLLRRQVGWSAAFLVALLLCIPGPLFAATQVRSAGMLPATPIQEVAVVSSLTGFLLTPILALVYAHHLRRTHGRPAAQG